MITLAHVDGNGNIVQISTADQSVISNIPVPTGQTLVEIPTQSNPIGCMQNNLLINGVLTPKPSDPNAASEALITAKIGACIQVDNAAEYSRSSYLTNGSGQAIEYQATLTDLKNISAATGTLVPSNYPWVNAEWQALKSTQPNITFEQAVAIVQNAMNDWITAGTQIKASRRTAKIAINAALDLTTIQNILKNLSFVLF